MQNCRVLFLFPEFVSAKCWNPFQNWSLELPKFARRGQRSVLCRKTIVVVCVHFEEGGGGGKSGVIPFSDRRRSSWTFSSLSKTCFDNVSNHGSVGIHDIAKSGRLQHIEYYLYRPMSRKMDFIICIHAWVRSYKKISSEYSGDHHYPCTSPTTCFASASNLCTNILPVMFYTRILTSVGHIRSNGIGPRYSVSHCGRSSAICACNPSWQ